MKEIGKILVSDDFLKRLEGNYRFKNPRLNRLPFAFDTDINSADSRFLSRPTESLEREYMQRSVLDERDEYDEALLKEIERRHQLEENLLSDNDDYFNFLSSSWTDYLTGDRELTLSRRR